MRKHRFTLAELLVTIAVVVILVSSDVYAGEKPGYPGWQKLKMQFLDLYRNKKDIPAAIEVAKKAAALAEEHGGPFHSQVARSLDYLAICYIHPEMKRYAEAEKLMLRVLAIQEKQLGSPDHPELAAYLHRIGINHVLQKKYRDAERVYKRALAINEKAHGTNHPDYAASLDKLADVYLRMGLVRKAQELSQRAKKIRDAEARK